MQEFSLSWDTNHLICQWKSNSSTYNCTNSKPSQMGHSSVRETAQFLFTFKYFISNNYSSGTISKAKYILHCKCKTFVEGFGHKHYLVHKRRKFSSYKILNWKYVSNIIFIHLCGIGKYSQIAFLIKDGEIWKLFQHWIVWWLKITDLRIRLERYDLNEENFSLTVCCYSNSIFIYFCGGLTCNRLYKTIH